LTVILATNLAKCLAGDHTSLGAVGNDVENILPGSIGSIFKSTKNSAIDIITGSSRNIWNVCDRQAVHRQNMDRTLISKIRIQNFQGSGVPKSVTQTFVDFKAGFQLILKSWDAILISR